MRELKELRQHLWQAVGREQTNRAVRIAYADFVAQLAGLLPEADRGSFVAWALEPHEIDRATLDAIGAPSDGLSVDDEPTLMITLPKDKAKGTP